MTYPKLKVEGVSKVFVQGRNEWQAIDNIDMTLEENEFVALVGASGCGKSTLLSIIAGLQDATDGVILVDGLPIDGPGRDRGVVFQSYTLMPWLTAQENVAFALRAAGWSKSDARQVAKEHLALVGLDRFADRLPSQLSGGMKQRVAIARALSYRPKILLMDEPFGALDALTRRHMQELLTAIWEKHRLTVLFVTHDVEEAVFLADRVIVMSNQPGRIKEIIPVDIARPRVGDVFSSAEFAEPHRRVLKSIREESLKLAVLDGAIVQDH